MAPVDSLWITLWILWISSRTSGYPLQALVDTSSSNYQSRARDRYGFSSVALNYSLETEREFRRVVDVVGAYVSGTKPVIAQACVDALQGPASYWPVRTGLSKRSFKVRRRGRQTTDRRFGTIINLANRRRPSGTRTYAQFVNRGIRQPAQNVMAVERTIADQADQIAAAVETATYKVDYDERA